MTYYEEFGLTPDASTEEIKESYRNLVRLMHPDQQTNEAVRQAAEREMKRINQICAILTDPERRRRYDAETSDHNERPAHIIIKAPPAPPPPRAAWETIAWIGAVVVCVALVSFAITRDSAPSASPDSSAAGARSGPFAPETEGRPGTGGDAQNEIANLRMQLRVTRMERDAAMEQLAKARSSQKPIAVKQQATGVVRESRERPKAAEPQQQVAATLPAPPILTPSSIVASVPEPLRPVFAGSWFYAAPKGSPVNKALYPPEYIETIIVEDGGGIHGRYRARYRVMDRAISPEVAFEFAGKSAGTSARLPWSGSGGAKGQVNLKLVSNNSLRVEWSATELGALGLVSGTAVLMRRPDQ